MWILPLPGLHAEPQNTIDAANCEGGKMGVG